MASLRRLIGFLVLTLVALVVAHDLVFLLTYGAGYDEALAHSGHDGSWATAVVVVLAAGIGLLGLATWRLYRLGVRRPGDRPGRRPSSRRARPPSAGDSSDSGGGCTRATTLLFVIQENLEHQRIGEALPGLSVLGSGEYSDAALVIAVVTLAVAVVGALFRWRRDLLVARIVSALQRRHRRPERVLRRPAVMRDGRPESFVGRGLAVRAPPAARSLAGDSTPHRASGLTAGCGLEHAVPRCSSRSV